MVCAQLHEVPPAHSYPFRQTLLLSKSQTCALPRQREFLITFAFRQDHIHGEEKPFLPVNYILQFSSCITITSVNYRIHVEINNVVELSLSPAISVLKIALIKINTAQFGEFD